MSAPDATTTLTTPGIDVGKTLRFAGMGPLDPCCVWRPRAFSRAWHTPDGPVSLHLTHGDGRVEAAAWGPGSDRAIAAVPALVGLLDAPPPLTFWTGRLRELAFHARGLHLRRVPWLVDKLWTAILQQRVTFEDASAAWRRLVLRHGAPAPGPAIDRPLHLPPTPAQVARMGGVDLRPLEIDRHRGMTLVEAARRAHHVARLFDAPERRQEVLRHLPGVGPWTDAMVGGLGLGDPDVLLVGDVHMPRIVCTFLTGETGDDARMAELLAPWSGQRFRVVRMLYETGAS